MTEVEGKMRTTLEIHLQIVNPSHDILWKKTVEHPIQVVPDEVGRDLSDAESLEFELDLPPGNYTLLSRIKNMTDGEQRSKAKAVKIIM